MNILTKIVTYKLPLITCRLVFFDHIIRKEEKSVSLIMSYKQNMNHFVYFIGGLPIIFLIYFRWPSH